MSFPASSPTEPDRGGGALESLRAVVEPRLGIDPRALGAFRIALGLLLLADLVWYRLPGLVAFYTDDGVLPRSLLAETSPTFAATSIHAVSGSAWVQRLLFLIAGCAAVSLAIGYRTRLSTGLSLLLLASLHARNPLVVNGGDTILLTFLLLGLFLPLDARWSLDNRRRNRRERDTRRVCSLATASILLHFVSIYAVNGLLKYQSDLWLSGTAVPRIFQLEEYIVGLGPLLADSPALLTAVNWLWIGLLSVSVGLVVCTDRLRIALAAAFVGAQLGIAATMRLGVFPFVMVAGLLLFFPPRVWDRVEAVVVELGSRSKPSLEGDPPTTTTDETARASAVSTAIPARVRRSGQLLRSAVLACLLVTSLLWQASGVGLVESPAAELDVELSDPHWSFFAPNPPDATRWYRVDATFESNEPTDGDGGSASVDRPPDAADAYSSTLWMRYGREIGYADERYYEPLAAYHCERLGRGVESVTIRHVEQPVGPDGPVEAPTSRERISRTCRPGSDDWRPDRFRRRPT